MAEQWTETYSLGSKDINKTFSTHDITFKVPFTWCRDECAITISVNGKDRGGMSIGESIIVDGVTFYLEDAPLPFGTPVILIVSGESEVFDMGKALLLSAVLIGLYTYFSKR